MVCRQGVVINSIQIGVWGEVTILTSMTRTPVDVVPLARIDRRSSTLRRLWGHSALGTQRLPACSSAPSITTTIHHSSRVDGGAWGSEESWATADANRTTEPLAHIRGDVPGTRLLEMILPAETVASTDPSTDENQLRIGQA